MNEDGRTFGQRVKERRAEMDLTQAELAKRAGVTQSTIAGIEADMYKSSKHALPIARALDVSAEWLLTGLIPLGPLQSVDDIYYKALEERGLREIPVYAYVLDYPDPKIEGWGGKYIATLHADARFISKQAFGIDAMTSAMTPDIRLGDTVIVDEIENWPPKPGAIVAARIDETFVVLRTFRDRGRDPDGQNQFELVPQDQNYASYSSNKDSIVVLGQVVEVRRLLNIE